MLAAAMPSLVGAMTDPEGFAGIDDMRLAVVTSDMGLSWGGHPYGEGDGWPGTLPCTEVGDDGAFQTYPEGTTVVIGGEEVECPDSSGSWIESDTESPDADLTLRVACLAQQGTGGCGWEQQLSSASRAVHRDGKAGFVRDDALLAVIVVSDEDDCSLKDGPSMFATFETQGEVPVSLKRACAYHQEFLYSVEHYTEDFRTAKGGAVNGVFFGAVVGAPQGPACEGFGDEISGCLETEEMQLVDVDPSEVTWFLPACTRDEGVEQVTKAYPARRMVELAIELGEYGYVSSICDADWSGAMDDIGHALAKAVDDWENSNWFEALPPNGL